MDKAEEFETDLEEIELDEEQELESDDPESENEPEDGDQEQEESETSDEDDDEVVVSIDGESPTQEDEEEKAAPQWVKELRKAHRDTQKENRELKAKLEEMSAPADKSVELGKKPTLEECDYDTDAYDKKLQAWYERKRYYDAQQEERKAEQARAEKEWNDKVQEYEDKKAKLKVRDFDDAENFVLENFSQTQQGMMISGAEDPALLIYALGKNQKKAQEISSIKDPVKFAFAVAKLETKLKVTNRKVSTKPEKKVRGSGDSSGAVDSQLERLRAEASKSGDFTKLNAYKRKLAAKK